MENLKQSKRKDSHKNREPFTFSFFTKAVLKCRQKPLPSSLVLSFLFASALDVTASANPVAMQFAHKMSNVIVNLEKGENFEGVIPANAEVYLLSTVPQAVIDLTTGDAAKDNYGSVEAIRCRQLSNTQYQGIVVPQSLTSRRPLVEVIIGDVSYLMEGKISYRPGMRHTISVTLDQNPEQIKIEIGGSIEGWN